MIHRYDAPPIYQGILSSSNKLCISTYLFSGLLALKMLTIQQVDHSAATLTDG